MIEAHVELGSPFNKRSGQNKRTLPRLGRNIIDDYEPPVKINVSVDGSVTLFHASISTPRHETLGGRSRLQMNINITASIPGIDDNVRRRDFTVVVTNS